MTMTKAKKHRTLKVGQMKETVQRLKKWKINRVAFNDELTNDVIDKSVIELEKAIRYFERQGLTEVNL